MTELDAGRLESVAVLVAGEHLAARAQRPGLPVAYTDPHHCNDALAGLLADGFAGVAAHADERCVGVL